MKLLILCPLVFLAGLIDSIAGGGGLISLTSYNAVGITGVESLGTNKFSSFIGGTIASLNYFRTKNYHIVSLIPAFAGALAGSAIGSNLVLYLSKDSFSVFMLAATPVVAAITLVKKNFDVSKQQSLSNAFYISVSLVLGLVVGFYDGFFGPGTGMFLQLGFITLLKLEPKKAAGNARIVNWASNFAAIITFIINGQVLYKYAVPCALCSILGNFTGSQLAIKKDVKIIRPLMLVVVSLLFVKILTDYLGIILF